ncbi:MAG: S-adenosylmethionine decarboxylase [Richelia sp. RM2_1_2]|nr:S-adenosylmethionine decarboxylase [Richelia sp. RM2_1_2]
MILDHKHLIVRATVNNPPRDVEVAKAWITVLVGQIGMRLVDKLPENPTGFYSDMPGNQGITAIAIIETSHVTLHIWDEEDPAVIQFDVYSCSDFQPSEVLAHFQIFEPVSLRYKFIDRNSGLEEL